MAPKPKKAAALRYRAGVDRAPRLTAKGSRLMAERIIQTAREHGIPLKEDPQLIEVLSTLDLYQEIPPALYQAVAEILVFLYKISHRLQENSSRP